MKRLGLLVAYVFVILLLAPTGRASAAEWGSYRQTLSATPNSPLAVHVLTQPAAQGGEGWSAQDTVEETGIAALLLLGSVGLVQYSRSARFSRSIKNRETRIAEKQLTQKDAESLLDVVDDVIVTTETYRVMRQSGDSPDKSVVHNVLSGLTRIEREAEITNERSGIARAAASEFRTSVMEILLSNADSENQDQSLASMNKSAARLRTWIKDREANLALRNQMERSLLVEVAETPPARGSGPGMAR